MYVHCMSSAHWEGTHISCLQDIHLEGWQEALFRSEWGGEVICATKSSNSRGVAILFSTNFEFTIYDKYVDPEGNYIILDITVAGIPRFTLVNIYGPNKDSPDFYKNIKAKVEEFQNLELIMRGDRNVVRNYQLDTYNNTRHNNPKAREVITDITNSLDLVDICRCINKDKHSFTWWTHSPCIKARLDYIYYIHMLALTKSCTFKPRYRSDHTPVRLQIDTTSHKPGPGCWKLNIDLLGNADLVKIVNKEIRLVKSIYAATAYNPDYVDSCPIKIDEFYD